MINKLEKINNLDIKWTKAHETLKNSYFNLHKLKFKFNNISRVNEDYLKPNFPYHTLSNKNNKLELKINNKKLNLKEDLIDDNVYKENNSEIKQFMKIENHLKPENLFNNIDPKGMYYNELLLVQNSFINSLKLYIDLANELNNLKKNK